MNPMVTTQHQIKQNAEELQDFLRDLNQWRDEMTRKEKEIGDVIPDNNPLPPIRGTRGGKSTKISVSSDNRRNKPKPNKIEKPTVENKPKRISSYDYNAWDKFDADKACEELETEEVEKREEVLELSEEEEDFETLRNREAAEESKERGNDFFRMGKIDNAIECYTQGILCDPKNPYLPANRALALLKKEMYSAAEQDCTLAIEIDPSYVKAYQRRGTARMALKNYEDAKDDFRKVMELEPGNRQAYDELRKLRKIDEMMTRKCDPLPNAKRIEITEIFDEEEKIDGTKRGIVCPIQKPPHMRSKKPLKRMRIREVSTKFNVESKPSQSHGSKSVEKRKTFFKCEETEDLVVPEAPQSLYQFQRIWKMLRNSKEKQYEYLKKIPCCNYAAIFDDFLESENISEFVNLFNDFYKRDGLDVLAPLKELAAVKRFQIQMLFLSSKDKKVIEELFDYLVHDCYYGREDVEDLAKLYQVKL